MWIPADLNVDPYHFEYRFLREIPIQTCFSLVNTLELITVELTDDKKTWQPVSCDCPFKMG